MLITYLNQNSDELLFPTPSAGYSSHKPFKVFVVADSVYDSRCEFLLPN